MKKATAAPNREAGSRCNTLTVNPCARGSSQAYRIAIYKELSKKTILGGDMMEEFSTEVNDYLQNMRR